MDKKRIEIIATAIMVFILIIAWMNSINVIRKRRSPAPVAASVSVAAEPKVAKTAQSQVKNSEPEDTVGEWGRDPFSGRVYTKASSAQGLGDLKVEGIIWDKRHPLVMINGKVLKIGDSFKGNVVVAIKEGSVTLSDGTRDLEVKVGK